MPDHGGGAPRAAAAQLVYQVAFRGRSLDAVLPPGAVEAERDSKAARDARLVRELTFGSIRHYFSLRSLVNQALDKPHAQLDSLVLCLLIVGAYQLRHTRIPDYAAVSATVKASRPLRKAWARGLINSVLRRLGTEVPQDDQEARFDQPTWLLDALKHDYPDDWGAIAAASNARAPQWLRVNRQRQTAQDYRARLAAAGLEARHGITPEALALSAPVAVADLPGYAEGAVSVQDQGAQLAAGLLEPRPGHRVLDACSAPGGKTQHLLETTADLELVALDIEPQRVQALRTELIRLGLGPDCAQVGDATEHDWWDGQPFDRVLLDAPCSGTGTLRRHPDIKLLKRAADLAAFQRIQSKLATSVWQTLAPGGILVYCTCSILHAENDAVMAAFLAAHPDARLETIDGPWGRATVHGRQLLPGELDADGFYYARLMRAAAT